VLDHAPAERAQEAVFVSVKGSLAPPAHSRVVRRKRGAASTTGKP
jgi:hypothetical protein